MNSRRTTNRAPPSITTLLDREPDVAKLTAHAERLLQLQKLLESVLPAQLARAARVANLRLGKLVIHAVNNPVAAKTRQIIPSLVEKLRQNGVEINEIEVKVQPVRHTEKRGPGKGPMVISERAKQALTLGSEKLPLDSPVRRALQQLIDKK